MRMIAMVVAVVVAAVSGFAVVLVAGTEVEVEIEAAELAQSG